MPGIGLGISLRTAQGAAPSLAKRLLALLSPGAAQLLIHPIDEAYLFQDRAGTIPVTADGQTVGLMLDASQGARISGGVLTGLGSELVTNGDFSNGTTGWAATGSASLSNVFEALRVENGSAVTGGASQTINTVAGVTYQWTYYVNPATSGGTVIRVRDGGTLSVISTATRSVAGTFSLLFVATGSTTQVQSINSSNSIGAFHEVDNISVREVPGYHLTAVSDPARGTFRRSGRHRWIEFNGTNTAYQTAALPAPGVDKAQVFAAVRKLSDAATRLICELSATAGTFPGSYYVATGDVGTSFSTLSRGGATVSLAQAASLIGAAAPDTSVLCCTHDIAGDLSVIRRNGVAGTNALAEKGTGNFNPSGAYPLNVGARNGVGGFHSGNLYGAFVTRFSAANLSTGTITAVESLLAAEIAGAP